MINRAVMLRSLTVACLFLLASIVLAQQAQACSTPCTKAQITTDINTNWPDNTAGAITPAVLRSTVLELVNSYIDINGSSSFTCPTHQFLVSIATLSSYSCAQPAASDITGLATSATTDTTNAANITSGTLPAARLPTAAITSGTIDGTTIGGVTPAAGTFSSLKLSTSLSNRMQSCVSVNFNSGNTDTAIPIYLPPGTVIYTISRIQITSASASISTATAGVFTTTGGGGTALVSPSPSALTVTTGTANTLNNTMILPLAVPNTEAFNLTSLQFRVVTPQGSAASANVCLEYLATP